MSKKILILFLSCFLIFSANILAGEYDVEGGGTISYKGFVPCGYDLNGSGEIDIWERCQLCHFFVMIDGIIEFVFDKIVPPLAILMLVVAGILLFSAGAAPAMKNKVKNMILYVGLGLVLIYSCWLLVSFLLSVFGVVEWTDPLGQGWFKIDCPISRTFVGGTKNPFKPGKNLGWHEEPKKPSGPPPPPPGDEEEKTIAELEEGNLVDHFPPSNGQEEISLLRDPVIIVECDSESLGYGKLYIYAKTDRYPNERQLLRQPFDIRTGLNGCAQNSAQGDKKTPIGNFKINYKINCGDTKFYQGAGKCSASETKRYGHQILNFERNRGIHFHGGYNDNGTERFYNTYGCVRLHNNDLSVLYNFIKEGTKVKIRIK